MLSNNNRQIGRSAEIIACNYLQQQNLTLLVQNFYSRFGEIDLIMLDVDTYVFVEVKKRKHGVDHAIESITPAKQKKLILAAQYYLLQIKKNINCRFDAVVMDNKGAIKWLKNVIIL